MDDQKPSSDKESLNSCESQLNMRKRVFRALVNTSSPDFYEIENLFNQFDVKMIDEPNVNMGVMLAGPNRSVDFNGKAFLHVAVINSCICVVRYLLERGACVNVVTTTSKRTPLHYAAIYSTPEMIDLLCRQPNIKIDSFDSGSLNSTPLHLAIESKDLKKVETLLKYRANPNLQDSEGHTCLHQVLNMLAQYRGECAFFRLKTNNYTRHSAYRHADIQIKNLEKILKVLMQHRVDPFIRDKYKRKADPKYVNERTLMCEYEKKYQDRVHAQLIVQWWLKKYQSCFGDPVILESILQYL